MNPRHGAGGWGLGLLLVLLSACPTEIPASLLLTVKSAPDVPAVESVRVRVFDEAGQAHPATPFSVAAPDAERKLGTLVIHPQTTTEGSAGAALRLRIQADGLARGATVASAVLAVTLEPGRQITRTIVLMAVASQGAGDGDGDGVPDVIDNCPHAANPDQNDRDRDGKGDVCDGQAGATGNDGGHADAAADA
ncbi:MAG TPA: thrombospondin type 3 repeat-containing protein, partial [Polyangia bacterium]